MCVLQFLLGLSDRQAAEAVRCRIQAPSLPKLRARVRFSSPAPERNPRSVAWGLFVV
ncbi:hypothetical protein [Streptomyces sp. NPDC003996]